MRGVLEDWRTMGPTEPVRSASPAVLRQLRESTRQQKLRDKTQGQEGVKKLIWGIIRVIENVSRRLKRGLHAF